MTILLLVILLVTSIDSTISQSDDEYGGEEPASDQPFISDSSYPAGNEGDPTGIIPDVSGEYGGHSGYEENMVPNSDMAGALSSEPLSPSLDSVDNAIPALDSSPVVPSTNDLYPSIDSSPPSNVLPGVGYTTGFDMMSNDEHLSYANDDEFTSEDDSHPDFDDSGDNFDSSGMSVNARNPNLLHNPNQPSSTDEYFGPMSNALNFGSFDGDDDDDDGRVDTSRSDIGYYDKDDGDNNDEDRDDDSRESESKERGDIGGVKSDTYETYDNWLTHEEKDDSEEDKGESKIHKIISGKGSRIRWTSNGDDDDDGSSEEKGTTFDDKKSDYRGYIGDGDKSSEEKQTSNVLTGVLDDDDSKENVPNVPSTSTNVHKKIEHVTSRESSEEDKYVPTSGIITQNGNKNHVTGKESDESKESEERDRGSGKNRTWYRYDYNDDFWDGENGIYDWMEDYFLDDDKSREDTGSGNSGEDTGSGNSKGENIVN